MISLTRPSIRRRDMDAVLSCMVTDSLGPGSLSDQLSQAVSEYLGLAGGIALRERGRAFAIAIDHLALEPGAAVVLDPLVPHSYVAIVAERGLLPLLVDVDQGSLCIDADQAERTVASATEEGLRVGAIVTHTTLGYVPAMDQLAALGVPIIEDISDGIGGNTGEERVGRFGRFVIVAMEPDAVITAGGGTLLVAANRTDRNALRRTAGELATDTLLPDMNAALGITQIKEIEKFIARRAEVAAVYARAIMRGRHRSPVQPGEGQNVYLAFPVLVEGNVGDVTAYAKKKGVECRRAFEGSALERYGRAAHEALDAEPEAADVAAGEAAADSTGVEAHAADAEGGGQNVGLDDEVPLPGYLRPDPAPIPEADFPVSRSLLLRCLVFPLYPTLTAKEVSTVERVLTTLP